MALPPSNNEAFLREVDEELRRDRLAGFWTRWGLPIAGAVVLGLALFGGWLYWQHRQLQAAGVEGEKLDAAYRALGANDAAKAQAPLAELAKSDRDGYRAMARFTQGDILLQKQDLRGAAAKFGEIAADASLAQPFRDLALVRQTAAQYDTLDPRTVVERLRPLAVAGNPWFGSAGEMVAVAQLRIGRRDLAGRMFGQIAREADAPDSIRQRAVQMAGVLGVDAVRQSEDTKTK